MRRKSRLVAAVILFLLASFGAQLKAQLLISEFLASNANSIADEDGNHEDWIEIQNSTATAQGTLGWYLTDDATRPRKWAFPVRTIPANGYLVVFASNKD